MARLFDDGATEYLKIETGVINAYPFAMACKFRCNDDTKQQVLMFVGDKDSNEYYCRINARGDITGDYIRVLANKYGAASDAHAATTAGYTANVWNHAAGIWIGVSERHAYIAGGNKGSDTDTVGAMANHDRTAIGANTLAATSSPFSGDIAEAGIWDLTDWGANDAERVANFEKVIASLAKGFTPAHFPLGLVAHWDLIRGLNDRVGGYNLTATGTVVSAHPRIIQPCGIL